MNSSETDELLMFLSERCESLFDGVSFSGLNLLSSVAETLKLEFELIGYLENIWRFFKFNFFTEDFGERISMVVPWSSSSKPSKNWSYMGKNKQLHF